MRAVLRLPNGHAVRFDRGRWYTPTGEDRRTLDARLVEAYALAVPQQVIPSSLVVALMVGEQHGLWTIVDIAHEDVPGRVY